MSRVSKIKEERPDLLEDDDFRELLENADKIHDIKVVAGMPGGKALIDFLLYQIVNDIHVLTAIVEDADHKRLVSIISRMRSNLATTRFLTTAKNDLVPLDERIAQALSE